MSRCYINDGLWTRIIPNENMKRNFPRSCAASIAGKKTTNYTGKIVQAQPTSPKLPFTRAMSFQEISSIDYHNRHPDIIKRSRSSGTQHYFAGQHNSQITTLQRYTSPFFVTHNHNKGGVVNCTPRKSFYYRQRDTIINNIKLESMDANTSICCTDRISVFVPHAEDPTPLPQKRIEKKSYICRFFGSWW